MTGTLDGVRVVEIAGIGPGPHCAMLLADMGAEVLRIVRPEGTGWDNPVVDRGRHTLTLDLRGDEGRATCLTAIDAADVLIEGMRPGVMERLGLGPQIVHERNPSLIYGRMTGWGQDGPLAHTAGHDINYIALTGALAAIGKPGEPAVPPLNMVGDFGGGSLYLALGVVAALVERNRSGLGQVVDAAIIDGVSSMMSFYSGLGEDRISTARDANLLGGAAPFYRCYVCADGREISVGSIEPQFYAQLLSLVDGPDDLLGTRGNRAQWGNQCDVLAAIFVQKSRDEWCVVLEGTDACFAPVLTLKEAAEHSHMASRGVYIDHGGVRQVAPAPRFSRTASTIHDGGDGLALLSRWTGRTF